jgi:hypothetical protein
LNYGLLVVILFLWQYVGSLGRFSSKLLVASRQDHLVEICKTEIAIFVVTVELNQEQQVFSLEFVAKVIGRILADECIQSFVIDSQLRLLFIDHRKEVITFKMLVLHDLLSQLFDMALRFSNKLEKFINRFHQKLFRCGVASA